MSTEFVSFGYDWQPTHVDIDLNDPRVSGHLKALIRGFGSSTENILIDFVLEQWKSISGYRSVQEAWSMLDADQKRMVAGLRSFLDKAHLCDYQSEHFPTVWYRKVVANEYRAIIDEWAADDDDLSIDEKVKAAEQAESRVRAQLHSDDKNRAWMVEQG